MLSVIVRGLADAGHHVHTVLAAEQEAADWESSQVHVHGCLPPGDSDATTETVLKAWLSVASRAEATWLIAPELDGLLSQAVKQLGDVKLFNCSGDMLDVASDKWKTSQALQSAGLPHPPTQLLENITQAWCEQTSAEFFPAGTQPNWVIKRRDGAGCEGCRVANTRALADAQIKVAEHQLHTHVVQPLLSGQSYSISAVFNLNGEALWLPPVTQAIAQTRQGDLIYTGGGIRLNIPRPDVMQHLAAGAIAACGQQPLGWVGVDMIFAEATQTWYVIEVNPRATTSLVGLSAEYSGNLIEEIFSYWTHTAPGLRGGFGQQA